MITIAVTYNGINYDHLRYAADDVTIFSGADVAKDVIKEEENKSIGVIVYASTNINTGTKKMRTNQSSI